VDHVEANKILKQASQHIMKIQYIVYKPQAAKQWLINQANAIIERQAALGFRLTLRALHYQLFSRELTDNTEPDYNRLSITIARAREAGLVDWDAIIDNTRNLNTTPWWDSPAALMRGVAEQFSTDRWARQPRRCEVWSEKNALSGVVGPTCKRYHVPYTAVRGFDSTTEMWGAGQRIESYLEADQRVTIIYLGDHDPAGFAMSADVENRLRRFVRGDFSNVTINRVAINPGQVQQYNLKPNWARVDARRYPAYVKKYGTRYKWELDALEPAVLVALVQGAIDDVIDMPLWLEATAEDESERDRLRAIAERWDDVTSMVGES